MPATVSDRPDSISLMSSYLQRLQQLRRALTLRTGSADLAEEAVQETWFRLNFSVPDEAVIRDRQSYILMVAANIATDILRRERRHSHGHSGDDLTLDALADDRPSVEAALIGRERLQQLVRSLVGMNAKAREVLILGRAAGMSHRDIAARLGISESMVAKYMAQALRHCRDAFRENHGE